MSLIPAEELKKQGSINFAPLVDFLFLVLAVFATLAVTRTALYDTEVKLVKINPEKTAAVAASSSYQDLYVVNLSITQEGDYKWISETSEFLMDGAISVAQELKRQQQLGLLPGDKAQTKILLHIDKDASWESIAPLILTIKESGFSVHPVYARQT